MVPPGGGTRSASRPLRAAVDRGGCIEAEALHQFFENAALCRIVFDNQYAGSHSGITISLTGVYRCGFSCPLGTWA
jgi:hypothetical protein